MSLPGGESFGAVFVTDGPPADPPRPSIDIQRFTCVEFQLKVEHGVTTDAGEFGILGVGVKDSCDPDTGAESKITLQIPSADQLSQMGHDPWVHYSLPLSGFTSADLGHIYVPIEFVFDVYRFRPEPAQIIDFREIRLTDGPCAPTPTPFVTRTATTSPSPTATAAPTATSTPLPCTKLSGDITAEATEIPLRDAASFPANGVLMINEEQILYDGHGSGPDTLAVNQRGFGGTSTASHQSGDAVCLAAVCSGDCNGDRRVKIDELVTLVNIALSRIPFSQCVTGDQNGNRIIEVNEIVAAVNNALHGCR